MTIEEILDHDFVKFLQDDNNWDYDRGNERGNLDWGKLCEFITKVYNEGKEEMQKKIMEKSTLLIADDNKKDNSFFKVPYRLLVERT